MENNIIENRNKELFPDTAPISKIVGDSDYTSVISSYTEEDNIGVAYYTNPKTNIVDVKITGKCMNNYAIAIRLYRYSEKNGKMVKDHTNRWTYKISVVSKDVNLNKAIIKEGEKLNTVGHELTEKTSISLDGIRIYSHNLNRGYKILTNSNGYIVTSNVELNEATEEKFKTVKDKNDIENLFKRQVNISPEEFNKIKEYATSLIPEIELIYNKTEGSVIIKLPVLVSTKTVEDYEG
jgi:hypothetical protein